MTNSAGFSLLLTNKCVKPICVSIFVLTFHRILSSSHSQSPGSRKPWFMFSVLINCMVAHCCPSCLASPTSTFRFLPPCLSYSSLSCIFFSFSWEYAFNIRFPSFSFLFFFLSLCLRVALPPTPCFLSLFSNQTSVRAGFRELCSTCISLWIVWFFFFFWTSANGWLVFAFVVTDLLPKCCLSWSCSAALHAGIARESKLT